MTYIAYTMHKTTDWDRAPVEAHCVSCGSIDWLPDGEHDCRERQGRAGGRLMHRRSTGIHWWCAYCGAQWTR